jgi:putative nucleotidyltransferase with HDIG domain
LYYLPVLQACVRVRFRDAVGAAVLAAGLYSFVCLAEGLNVPVATVSYLRLATYVTLCVFFAVMSAQLMRETRAHREKALQLELLAGVTRELQSSLRLGELLQSIAVSTREAFGHEQVAIYLGEEADQLSLQACSPPDEASSAQPPAALGFAREAVANGRIAVSRGTAPANTGVELGDDALPTIAVPLTVQGETAGALVVVAGPRFRFSRLTVTVLQTLADLIGDPIRNVHLYEHTLFGAITALSLALGAKSHQARGHSQRVSVAAMAIARELGLSERHRTSVRLAALLHDIGKIGVADRILNGPTGLSADELEELRGHPESGAEMLASIPQLEAVARIIRHHHERLDGGGYPDGLAGEEIPLGARIIAVADAIDAIIFERTYGDIHTEEEAVAEVQAHAGSQFDPEVVAAATRVYERTGRLIGRPGVVPISSGVYETAIHDDPPDSELTAS